MPSARPRQAHLGEILSRPQGWGKARVQHPRELEVLHSPQTDCPTWIQVEAWGWWCPPSPALCER